MLYNRAKSLKSISKIDVTGFSCVMAVVILTLLGIEMVAFPDAWGHHGVGVDLPRVNHSVKMLAANREDAIVVVIMRDGKVFFGNEPATAEQLPEKIRKRLGHYGERKVYVKADARVRYGTVLIVLGAVRSSGVEKIAFLADQRRVSSVAP